jgi:hypothetical protein
MAHSPNTSPLLLLIDALNRSVDPEHHTKILTDSLQRAGLVDVPSDRGALRDYVNGALTEVVTELAGEDAATEIAWTLRRQTSVRAPSSKAPSSRAPRSGRPPMNTAGYTGDLFANRVDVLVIDGHNTVMDSLRIHLEARDLSVVHQRACVDVDRDVPPRAVVVNVDRTAAMEWAKRTADLTGERVPQLVLLEDNPDGEIPAPFDRVIRATATAEIVATLNDLLGLDV